MRTLAKVITGGQTGVDQAALRAARACGVAIGGWCPPERESEAGPLPADLPLTETPRDTSPEAPDVPRSLRTEWNVRDSDATLVVRAPAGAADDPGTGWTLRCAARLGRPVLVCDPTERDAPVRIARFIRQRRIETLHVAGPAESACPGIGALAERVLARAFATARARDSGWPATADALAREQRRLASLRPEPWRPHGGPLRIGACAVVFGRSGREDVAWAAAAVEEAGQVVSAATEIARVEAPYEPGQLALREGPVLAAVLRRLPDVPEVLLVAGTGRDHPRGAGLALHVGAVLDLPTVGVTDDPLLATGGEPGAARTSTAPLRVGEEVVAYRVRTRAGARPVVAHAAWRTSPEIAADLVIASCAGARWPNAMREARRLAREARARRA